MEALLRSKRFLREYRYTRKIYASLADGWARIRIAIYELTEGRYYTALRFDHIFRNAVDPWGYSACPISEQRKHLILDALPRQRYKRLFEVGCAEGWMTSSLATRADELVAADISYVALARAGETCCHLPNVQFVQFDLLSDPVVGFFDGIVCAGVLVYLPMSAQHYVRDQLVASLASDGDLLLEHTRDAFPGEVAGSKIHALFRNHPELTVVSHGEMENYAITLFRKVSA